MKPYRQIYDVKNAACVKLDRYQIIGKELKTRRKNFK